MKCFLKDAAEKQGRDERIRRWISEVREVAQDAEDAIEIFTLKVDTPTRKRDLVRKWAGFPSHVSHLNKVGKEIESIRTRLDEIAKRRERYGIRNLGDVGMESSSTSRSEIVELRRRMRVRLQKDKDVVGLNEDADLLLNEVILDNKRMGLSLAAIVGMGGIGKSTLARKIYNHPAIAWVVVSSEFAAEDIMKQIMHELSVPLDADELKTLESIQDKVRRLEMLQDILRKRLEGKEYFIVLDDVWEHTHWGALETAFPNEHEKTSRLLFTSRNQIITEHRGYIHKMKLLNSDESWELLLKTSFADRGEGRCPDELKDVGREILKNCHGLPLAITVAGGLLVNQGESKGGWERVLKQIKNYYSETSEETGTNSVSAILELSYQNLPSQLKPCFLCLAFFKEDAVIRPKRLLHIWVALGLVKVQGSGNESLEEIERSYLDELINRNLILVKSMSIDAVVKYCYVHDLVRELSIRKAREEIGFESITNEVHEGSSSSSSSNIPRHRVVRGIQKRQITWNQNKHLRSLFLQVEDPNYAPSNWKGFELLRILDIEGSRLPISRIRALIGIRYLRLREDGVLRLPSWLDALKNLEVLDIVDCDEVIFPDVTWRMDHLRYFYMHVNVMHVRAVHILFFSDSMKKSSWKSLETLKYIWSDVLFANPMRQFSLSVRKLGIVLTEDGEEEQAEMGRLLAESEVQVLHLIWKPWIYKELPILNSLDHLTKLKLDGYLYGPSADMFPQNITHLTLSWSLIERDDVIQELGKLPNLLFLTLIKALSDNHVSIKVSHDGFPKLKVLHLRWMKSLKKIKIKEGGMPMLQRLEIYECLKLGLNVNNLKEHIKPAEVVIIS